MGLNETKNIKIAGFDFIREIWALILNGPAVSETKLQRPRIECNINRQQNQNKLPEGRFFIKWNFVCLDIDEQDEQDKSLMAVHKETNNTKMSLIIHIIKESRDHRKNKTCQKFTAET